MRKLVFALTVCLLIMNVFALFVFDTSSTKVSLTTFIDKLQDMPNLINLNINDIKSKLTINGDWGAFNFLLTGINGVTSVISVLIFFCTSIVNVIYQVIYLLYVMGVSSFY